MKKLLPMLIVAALVLACPLAWRAISQAGRQESLLDSWSHADVGDTRLPGNISWRAPVYEISGAGAGIFGASDAFAFLQTQWVGDCVLVANVLTVSGLTGSGAAGLIIRSDLAPHAPGAFLGITTSRGLSFIRRSNTNGLCATDTHLVAPRPGDPQQNANPSGSQTWIDTATNARPRLAAPCWLMLVRRGPELSAWCSANGTNWHWLGTDQLNLPREVRIGLAVAGGDPAQPGHATFGHVSVAPLTDRARSPWIGSGDGLLATLSDRHGTNTVQRVQPTINFGWVGRRPAPSIELEGFSGVWEGSVQGQFTEPCAFYLEHDDDARLWIDGRLIIDNRGKVSRREAKAVVALVAGTNYPIRLEYAQGRSTAVLKLSWSSPSTPKQIIPRSQLYSPTQTNLVAGVQIFDTRDGLEALQLIDSAPALPAPWLTRGLRQSTHTNPAVAARASNNIVTIAARGNATGAGSDEGRFVYQPWRGDVQLVTRINAAAADSSSPGADAAPAAKAGLMIRENLKEDSRTVFVAVSPRESTRLFHRADAAIQSKPVSPNHADALNSWLKLVRRGDSFTAWTSPDGAAWTWLDTVSVAMTPDLFVGLAAGGDASPLLHEAQFEHTRITSPPPLDPVIGSGDGLAATYYDGAGTNAFAQVASSLNYFWGNRSPASRISGETFRVRWQGLLEPQFSETYRLHIINDSSINLWLDGKPLLRGANGPSPRERILTLPLLAGHRYALKIDYTHTRGEAAFRLLWSSPNTPLQPVPQSQLYSAHNPAYAAINDKDQDQLPDNWETAHRLDPLEAGADQDPDRDGLTNLEEFRAGTNPRSADTDGDTLPDGWELRHKLLALDAADAPRDADQDGLSNLAEFVLGTNPRQADTDRDGLNDAIEAREMHYLLAGGHAQVYGFCAWSGRLLRFR